MRSPCLLPSLYLAFLPSIASYQIPLKQWLADNAIAWAASRGLQIASAADEKNPGAPRFVHLPISLLPLPFPKSAFDEAVEVAPVFNLLVDRVSRDNAWLKSTLSEVSIQMDTQCQTTKTTASCRDARFCDGETPIRTRTWCIRHICICSGLSLCWLRVLTGLPSWSGVCAQVRGSDPFTGRLLSLHESCQSEGVVQAASLGLHRSDYMLDQSTPGRYDI